MYKYVCKCECMYAGYNLIVIDSCVDLSFFFFFFFSNLPQTSKLFAIKREDIPCSTLSSSGRASFTTETFAPLATLSPFPPLVKPPSEIFYQFTACNSQTKSKESKIKSLIPLPQVVSNFPSDFEEKVNFPSDKPITE